MNKEFIPYEEALTLKQIGFCYESVSGYSYPNSENLLANAILYQQAFRFFREKYKLCGTPQYFTGGFYCYTINNMQDQKESNRLFTEFKTYEEAELACLKKLIEIVKNK
jgi:hypothetical protein